MPTTLNDMLKRLATVQVKEIAEDATYDTAPDMARLNREQLEEGFDSNGARLRPYRNPKYASRKNSMNPKPGYGNPDLKLTGSFYRGIRADVEGDKIHVYSTDSKDPALAKKYGTDIYGLGPKRGEYISNHLRPEFIRQIKAKLKL